jgi:cell wall-associated NlpC family hydrolase
MTKTILYTLLICLGISVPGLAQKAKQGSTSAPKTDVKFLENISVDVAPTQTSTSDPKAEFTEASLTTKKTTPVTNALSIESASSIQFKYALLLDVEVEMIQNLGLIKTIDEWFGTRYKLGGSTKDGIDCSALMQVFISSIYGITIPRTAREQFSFSRRISRAEIKEGDLVFFNTVGGISHVGMYLQNNKFVHASSNGVTISDLDEDYWLKHFIGAGRIEPAQADPASSTTHP